jgi:glycosyltransferase involved in cell wall biosynthesis
MVFRPLRGAEGPRPGLEAMQKVQMTVLLATRNGERVLARTLEGYCRASAPPVAWKLVVVDNGSTDATPDIIEHFKRRLPLESLVEPVTGKSRALNTGLYAVEGRIAVMTDDDAIPSPTFLAAWAKLLDHRTDYKLFGGSIDPLFDVAPPRWLAESKLRFAMMFAHRDLPEGPIGADEIYGPNMAVRTSVLDQGFQFDEKIGPNAEDPDYPTGGETDFCWRVAQSGAACWFAKEPLVHHIVRPEQLILRNWIRRAYRTGRGRAHQMWERGGAIIAPRLSLLQRLAMFSPIPRHRFDGASAYHLLRGFREECARRNAIGEVATGAADPSRSPAR